MRTETGHGGARRARRHLLAPALLCALGAALAAATPASAQFLRSNPLPPGEVGGQAAGPADPSQLTVRIDQLEGQVRSLTGQVEQYEFRIRQLEDQLRRFQEDVEFRFREGGAAGASAGTGGMAPQPRIQPQPAPQPQPLAQRNGNPPTYGGTQPLRAPDQPGYVAPAASEPLNINPAARNRPDQPLAGQPLAGQPFAGQPPAGQPQPQPGGNAGTVALAVPQDAQTSYDIAYAFILQRDFEAAQTAFADFLQRYPGDKLAGNAQYWLGESHYAQGRYREAADAFLTGYRQYPTGGKGPDSLLKLGMSLAALGEKQAACSTYAEFAKKFPGASESMKNRVRAEQMGAGC